MKKSLYGRNITHVYEADLDKTYILKTAYINTYTNLFYFTNWVKHLL